MQLRCDAMQRRKKSNWKHRGFNEMKRLLYWNVSRKSAEGRRYRNIEIYVHKGHLDIRSLYKTTALRLTISETPPFLWTPEISCLGIPVRYGTNISCKLTPRSVSSSIKPHSGIKSRIFVGHLISSPRSSVRVLLEIKRPRDRKEKFAVRGDSEHRIRRHRGPIGLCNSVWTKLVTPTHSRLSVQKLQINLRIPISPAKSWHTCPCFQRWGLPLSNLSWKMRRTVEMPRSVELGWCTLVWWEQGKIKDQN